MDLPTDLQATFYFASPYDDFTQYAVVAPNSLELKVAKIRDHMRANELSKAGLFDGDSKRRFKSLLGLADYSSKKIDSAVILDIRNASSYLGIFYESGKIEQAYPRVFSNRRIVFRTDDLNEDLLYAITHAINSANLPYKEGFNFRSCIEERLEGATYIELEGQRVTTDLPRMNIDTTDLEARHPSFLGADDQVTELDIQDRAPSGTWGRED